MLNSARPPYCSGKLLRLGILTGSLVLGLSQTASAQSAPLANNCLADVSSKGLVCTANDVSVAAVDATSVNVFQGGFAGTNKCIAGGKFSFTATFEVKTTSSKTRSNIGIFFGTGQNSALSGICTDAILAPAHSCANGTATCGDLNYSEKDGAINGEVTNTSEAGCGDTSSGDSSTLFGAGTHAATLEVDGVTCPTSGTTLTLPVCTSWYQPTNTMPSCESPAPSYPWQPQAIAGTGSKCTCGTLSIPVQPVTPGATISKTCNSATSVGTGLTSCAEGPGDVSTNTVTYHVGITNSTPTGEGGIVIDQICDNLYGTIYQASPAPTGLTACPTGSIGTNGTLNSTTCGLSTLGNSGDIGNGSSATCDFIAHQKENLTEMDTVTVSGHSDLSTIATFGCGYNSQSSGCKPFSNTVTATSSDSPSTSITTRGLDSTQAACATVRYNVNVHNSSGADETLTLNTPLTDSAYGDITTLHGSVLGTTCGVATTAQGLGTLSGKNGSGTFPATLGSDYQCQFDGEFCGPILPNAEQFGTGVCTSNVCTAGKAGTCDSTLPNANAQCDQTCTGISQTAATVTGTITGDDTSPADTVSQTINGLNLTECLGSFTSSH